MKQVSVPFAGWLERRRGRPVADRMRDGSGPSPGALGAGLSRDGRGGDGVEARRCLELVQLGVAGQKKACAKLRAGEKNDLFYGRLGRLGCRTTTFVLERVRRSWVRADSSAEALTGGGQVGRSTVGGRVARRATRQRDGDRSDGQNQPKNKAWNLHDRVLLFAETSQANMVVFRKQLRWDVVGAQGLPRTRRARVSKANNAESKRIPARATNALARCLATIRDSDVPARRAA